MTKKKYTFIDLFASRGGLSEGFLQTGNFEGLAHIEWEMPMVKTLRQHLIKNGSFRKIYNKNSYQI
jgi:DNA (cytosine-5)-methyltransferase 1